MKRVTVEDVKKLKGKEPFAMLTAYDYAGGRLVDEAGLPMVLVGDSLGMVVLGYDSTIPVTMEEMLHHVRAVARGVSRALVVADMPFMSYHLSAEQALSNAGRFLQEGGAQAVKLEGGVVVADKVRRLVDCGIPVMGHIGLTPQSVHQIGGYRTQGKTPAAAARLIEDARALEAAGAFSVVLECVPDLLAKLITERTGIPTIGIGAGPHCDGQVQVFHDLLGLTSSYLPKHARRYADLHSVISEAVRRYAEEVRTRSFPAEAESFGAGAELRAELEGLSTPREQAVYLRASDDPILAEIWGNPEDAVYDETPLTGTPYAQTG